MILLLLHGSGWDEFLLMGGAIALAFVIVRLTTRGDDAGSDDPPGAEPSPRSESETGETPV